MQAARARTCLIGPQQIHLHGCVTHVNKCVARLGKPAQSIGNGASAVNANVWSGRTPTGPRADCIMQWV